MKRIICLLLALITLSCASAQTDSSIKHDFFLDVLFNPSFNLYDFYLVGHRSSNTRFLPESSYQNSKRASNKCKELGISVHDAYTKIQSAWKVYLTIQNTNKNYAARVMSVYSGNNIFAPECPDPALKRKFQIIPLKQ